MPSVAVFVTLGSGMLGAVVGRLLCMCLGPGRFVPASALFTGALIVGSLAVVSWYGKTPALLAAMLGAVAAAVVDDAAVVPTQLGIHERSNQGDRHDLGQYS